MPTAFSSLSLTGAAIAVLRSLAAPLICIATLVASTMILDVRFTESYTALAITSALLYYIFMRSFVETGWQNFTSRWDIALHAGLAWFAVVGVLLLLGYATKVSAVYSRRALFTWVLLTPSIVTASLVLLQIWYRHAIVTSGNTRSAVIAGVNKLSLRLAKSIQDRPELGLKIKGFFDDRSVERLGIKSTELLGNLSNISSFAKQESIDAIFIALPLNHEKRMKALLDDLRDTTISMYYIPDIFVFDLIQAKTDELDGIPIVTLCESPFYGWRALIKRSSDIVLALLMLLTALPTMCLIALAIKFTSTGNVIFKQRRYGLDGAEIVVYKFRTMIVSEDGEKVVQASRHDTRITPIGRLLRRYSLDELPQLINVLQGRMSVVGPRPHAVAHNEEYRKLISGYMVRHKVAPGITGLAQVNGCRGETNKIDEMEKRIHYDLEYLRSWSLGLDLKILLRTVTTLFRDEKAY